MTYATKQDLIDRYGENELIQLTDRTNAPQTTIDDTVVNQALAAADELVNSYIGAKYDLPLASVPGRLLQLACEIARYYLHKDAPTEKVKDDYESALKFLGDVARGNAVLDVGGKEPPASGGTAQIQSQERVFSREKLQGF